LETAVPTTKLELYNAAIALLGDAPLAALDEDAERRRSLDNVYTRALQYCLEQGLWNWAKRSIQASDVPSVVPTFGFSYAFTKPDDWVRTVMISADPQFQIPLHAYEDEQGYWWANITPIYVTYVSNDAQYGLDLGQWPQTFCEFVETHLAQKICPRTVQNAATHDMLLKLEAARLKDARSKDAMNEPSRRPPYGAWVNSRSVGRTFMDRFR
jgi:hypothetical protein